MSTPEPVDGGASGASSSPIEDLIARLSATSEGQALFAGLAQSLGPSFAEGAFPDAVLSTGLAMGAGPGGLALSGLFPAEATTGGDGAAFPSLGDLAGFLADDPLDVGEWAGTTGLATIEAVAERAGLLGLGSAAVDPVLRAGGASGGALPALDPATLLGVTAPPSAGTGIMDFGDILRADPLAAFLAGLGESEEGGTVTPSHKLAGLTELIAGVAGPGPFLPAGLASAGRENASDGSAPPFLGGLCELLSLVLPEVTGRSGKASSPFTDLGGGMSGSLPDPAIGRYDDAGAALVPGPLPFPGLDGGLAEVLADPVLSAAGRAAMGATAPAGFEALAAAPPDPGAIANVFDDVIPPDTMRRPRGLWAPADAPPRSAMESAHGDELSSVLDAFMRAEAAASPLPGPFGAGAFAGAPEGGGLPYQPMLPPALAAAGLAALGYTTAGRSDRRAAEAGEEAGETGTAPNQPQLWSLPPGLLDGPRPGAAVPFRSAWGRPSRGAAPGQDGTDMGAGSASNPDTSGSGSQQPLHDMVLSHRLIERVILDFVDRACSGPATGPMRPDPGLRLRPGAS